ncbi:MAG: SPFH domain-containing protein [Planctomycetota bacterium]
MAEDDRDDRREEEEVEPLHLSSEGDEPEPEESVAEEAAGAALAGALRSSFRFLKWVMVLFVIGYLANSLFTVDSNEVKFKLAFGRIIRAGQKPIFEPGTVHIRWPWEEVEEVYTDEQVLELEREFWAGKGDGPQISNAESLSVRTDGYLLTGDANIVHMRLRVRYSVRDDSEGAIAYKFHVQEPEQTLRRIAMAAATEVVASQKVMDVINRKNLFDALTREVRERLEEFEQKTGAPLGINVAAVEAIEQQNVKNPTEPGMVSRAFFEAQNAANKRDALINEGNTVAGGLLKSAEAKAAEIQAQARGYAVQLVRTARADARQMEQLLPIYQRAEAEANILRNDFYARQIVRVLEDSPGAFVLHEPPDSGSRELRVILTRQPVQQEKSPRQQPGAPGQQGAASGQ